MIAIARQFDAAAKFSGSGGAIVGLLTDQSRKTKMKETFNKNGFVYLGTYFTPTSFQYFRSYSEFPKI